ncbi:MAG: stress response serine/threonine protein kinase YihE [Betaproteobacteria bacterium RIFCSPLOWO2_02_FULL_66_14]|nr:MAG: stress response serine/threonine protein kinase YihE [Betaproteobacteria bacterium RIFCSPLOWO2_02_FULL_66_14]
MSDETTRPYAGLTPEVVLDALESTGLRGDGRLLALNSFENRVYLANLEGAAPDEGFAARSVVAKFYRPARWSDAQIGEEHAFARSLAELEIPVVAPQMLSGRTLHEFAGFRFAVYPRCGGRPPELEDPNVLEWIGRFIGRIHSLGAAAPFRERPALDLEGFGKLPRDWLLANANLPAELKEVWRSVADQALDGVRVAWERAGRVATIRLHGDCHVGNILWTEPDARRGASGGPHFVDLDDARSGPAVQDLWMLLPGERAVAEKSLAALLRGYERFFEFDRGELCLVEALRTLRLLHYAYWIARRWDDPAFPAAFPWFGTQRYWEDRIQELREQISAMQDPPLAC